MSHPASRWHIQRLRKAQLNEPSDGDDTTAERNNVYDGDNTVNDVDETLPGAYAITNQIQNESPLPLWDASDRNTPATNQVFQSENSSSHESSIQNGEDVPNSSIRNGDDSPNPLDLDKNYVFEKPKSVFAILCSSTRYQILCLVIFLAIAAAIIVFAIEVSSISPAPSPTSSSIPIVNSTTRSPSSNEWNFNSEIVSDKVSFGYDVKLSADGNILVVSSPYHENGKGRFDVYTIDKGTDKITWNHLLPVSGTKVQGTNSSALMSHGMSLSADGSTVAIGSPGHGNGLVDIYMIDFKTKKISQKGNPIQGPTPLCEFGFSVALNSLGTRLYVGAPNYGQIESERKGLVRAYDYNSVTDSWIQVGSDMTGESIDSRFGQSIASSYDGSKVIIGAPLDSAAGASFDSSAGASFNSTKVEHPGTFYCFTLEGQSKLWYHYPRNQFYGDAINAQLGYNVAVDKSGEVIVTSQRHIMNDVHYADASVVMVYVIDKQLNFIKILGSPISGAYENAPFGSQVDVNAAGDIIVASDKHGENISGTVRAFNTVTGNLVAYGAEIPGIALGSSCKPRGNGPSLSIAITSNVKRLAIGNECISIDGKQKPASAVHIYEIS